MLLSIYIIILCLNFFLAIKEKSFNFIILITNIYIFLLLFGARDRLDLKSYLIVYDLFKGNISNPQILFYGLIRFFNYLNYSFFGFRGVFIVLCLLFIYIFAKKISLNIHLVYASYMSYLIFLDYIQLRNFIASSIFYIALIFLIRQEKKWRIWYAFFITIAALIHSSFWIYFILLFIPTKEGNYTKIVKTITIFALLFSIMAVFFRNYLSFISEAVSIVDSSKGSSYAARATNFGGLYFISLHIFITFSIGQLLKNFDNFQYFQILSNYNVNISKIKQSLKMIFLVDLFAFTLCPFVVFSITFYRLLRNLYLMNIIGFSLYGLKNRPIWVFILFTSYIALWAFVEFNGINLERLILPLFETNVLFLD